MWVLRTETGYLYLGESERWTMRLKAKRVTGEWPKGRGGRDPRTIAVVQGLSWSFQEQ